MSTPIDGFRKNLEATIPELAKECDSKVANLEEQLFEQRAAQSYLRSIAVGAGIDLKPRTPKIETDAPMVVGNVRASSEAVEPAPLAA